MPECSEKIMPRCLEAWDYYQEGVDVEEIQHKWNLEVWWVVKDFVKNDKAIKAYEFYLERLEEGYNEDQIKDNMAEKWDETTLSLVERAIKLDAAKPS